MSSTFLPFVPKKPNPSEHPLGKRIAEACDSLGLERQEVAERLGISRKQLHRIIQGTSDPTAHTLTRIVELTGYSADYLLTGRIPEGADPELLGVLVDGLRRVYLDEGVHLPDVELGRLAAIGCGAISARTRDPQERKELAREALELHRRRLREESPGRRSHGA